MLKLEKIVPFNSEEVTIDEFTQTVKWPYLGKIPGYYLEFGNTDKSLFQVGIFKDGRLSEISLIIADHVHESSDLLTPSFDSSGTVQKGIPVFVLDKKITNHFVPTDTKFKLFIDKSTIGIILDEFQAMQPDKYIAAERVVFAFCDEKWIATYITSLTKNEMQAIRWKYLR